MERKRNRNEENFLKGKKINKNGDNGIWY
jgi:hypothetical protein